MNNLERLLGELNPEKREIVETEGNVLVMANPGTGKTMLLSYKYLQLLMKGVPVEDILCLTFTKKAKIEMENRIISQIREFKLDVDMSKLNIFTFHSYAMENLDDSNIMSSNLLRYSIFKYLKDNEVLTYGDSYLLETIVPKMENLIRYLKSFGIMPGDINLEAVNGYLEDDKRFTKEELERFAESFVEIFKHYEEVKRSKGCDYTDLLLDFLKLRQFPHYKHVLVDELQDVNKMEAEIALKSGDRFFVVGDKKQAIFGFQGGSILNFEMFQDSKKFILGENFRSTNEILGYARAQFVAGTAEASHREELENLRNNKVEEGEKPKVISVDRDNVFGVAAEIAKKNKNTAIMVRTNLQIMRMSRELSKRGIEHSSTFFSGSSTAKEHIIGFLKGLLGSDMQDITNAMFTPFFPISLQDAFRITEIFDIKLEDVYKECPEFRKLREQTKNVEDVNLLFKERLLPIAVTYGKDYFLATLALQEAWQEALGVLDTKNWEAFIAYLESADLLPEESATEHNIILTTVHKAKGRQFDNVVYIPRKPKSNENFQDQIVGAILKSKGIDAKEELNEEILRIDFVAFTRAKKRLYILAEKPAEYLNDLAQEETMAGEVTEGMDFSERAKRAYNLFVEGEYDKARELLSEDKAWLVAFVKAYFDRMDRLSYSSLPESAYDYFVSKILGINDFGKAVNIGSRVHAYAEKRLCGEECAADADISKYTANVDKLLSQIKEGYPDVVKAEEKLLLPISTIMDTASGLNFKGFIDAIFKNGDEYLIVDWKTDSSDSRAPNHRQQLEAYKRAYSQIHGIPLEKIKVAIGYVGLRARINDGEIGCLLDDKQPAKSAFETFCKKCNRIIAWKENPDSFLNEFFDEGVDDHIWRSIVEQWERENGN